MDFDNGDGTTLQGNDSTIHGQQEGQKFDDNGNPITDINNNDHNDNNDDKGNGNGDGTGDGTGTGDNNNNNNGDNNNNDNHDNNDNDIVLEEGMTVEVPNGDKVDTYTVDKDGNLVDKDGNIFKEAKDVKDFLKDYSAGNDDDKDQLTLENIQTAIGIEVTDDKGNKLEYENTPEGVKSYINDVIENQKKEIAEASVNALFDKYPIVADFLNYYVANGNSYEGFGENPDRSNVTLDENNEAQQENIIRTAWKEQNRHGDVDGYINWLKSSGTLYATAKTELEGLQANDKARKEDYERKAQQAEQERVKQVTDYWNGVNTVIKSRKIAGYTIPDSIITQKDGHKVAQTPDDFFNYLYQVDKDGHSRYENDLLKLTPEQRRDDEILRAYLTFTGGSYADLVKMAVNEEKIKTIKLQAKNADKRTIRVTPKANNNKDNHDFGY